MRSTAHRYYVALGLLVLAAYGLTGTNAWVQAGWAAGVGYLGALGVILGIRRHRPAPAAAWWCFAAGVFLNSSGQLVETAAGNIFHVNTFPSVADAFYLALYPGLIAGALLLIRRRTAARDWASMVDATTISTGLGLLCWIFLIRPAAADPTLSVLGHSFSLAYPVGDVAVLAMMVRLMVGGASKNTAFRFIAGGLALFLSGDIAWAVINQAGLEPGVIASNLLAMIFLLAYLMFGAAAMHPSVRELAERTPPREARLSPPLLALLSGASLIAPATLVYQVVRHQITDGVAIAAGSAVLFLLVVTRMAQLLHQVEKQAIQLRELARFDELTGLPNRRAWTSDLPAAIERARRDGQPLTVAMLDLDHFKLFNDQFGHQAGDRLLKTAAAAWSSALRRVDQLARYGGEEFIILLPAADGSEAVAVLERLRPATPAGQTFSAGLATWNGSETSEELLARADHSLYEAKSSGRNQILVAERADQRLAREVAS